ncbi:hypothetical protein ACN20G_16470 [Streptomyces sp. BI20]|uniref:hypothetical protein n=1 Tax=Streptomyces sp. BI20 TaxID=3403460 RepID=UPI003C731082
MSDAPSAEPPFRLGELVTGPTYVPREHPARERSEIVTGRVVQVGSGWAGVDADQAYLWVRMACGRERQMLMRDADRG